MQGLVADQAVRDHANDLSTCRQGTVSDRAHQAGATAAVNQSPAAFANLATDFTGNRFKRGGLAHSRATVNAQGQLGHHGLTT